MVQPHRMEQSLSRRCNTLSCNAANPGSLDLLAQQRASPRCTRVLTRKRGSQKHSGVQNERRPGEPLSVFVSRGFGMSVLIRLGVLTLLQTSRCRSEHRPQKKCILNKEGVQAGISPNQCCGKSSMHRHKMLTHFVSPVLPVKFNTWLAGGATSFMCRQDSHTMNGDASAIALMATTFVQISRACIPWSYGTIHWHIPHTSKSSLKTPPSCLTIFETLPVILVHMLLTAVPQAITSCHTCSYVSNCSATGYYTMPHYKS